MQILYYEYKNHIFIVNIVSFMLYFISFVSFYADNMQVLLLIKTKSTESEILLHLWNIFI